LHFVGLFSLHRKVMFYLKRKHDKLSRHITLLLECGFWKVSALRGGCKVQKNVLLEVKSFLELKTVLIHKPDDYTWLTYRTACLIGIHSNSKHLEFIFTFWDTTSHYILVWNSVHHLKEKHRRKVHEKNNTEKKKYKFRKKKEGRKNCIIAASLFSCI